MNDNIVLIGFMGVGKSEVGRVLAAGLGMKYVDTDSLIEKDQGRSISDIFELRGEAYFRDLESKLLEKMKDSKKQVISTGGGMVLREGNVKKLKALGPLVLLTSRADVIEKRLGSSVDRPLLKGKDRAKKIVDILKTRDPIYNKIADLIVDTSDASPAKAADVIVEFYEGMRK